MASRSLGAVPPGFLYLLVCGIDRLRTATGLLLLGGSPRPGERCRRDGAIPGSTTCSSPAAAAAIAVAGPPSGTSLLDVAPSRASRMGTARDPRRRVECHGRPRGPTGPTLARVSSRVRTRRRAAWRAGTSGRRRAACPDSAPIGAAGLGWRFWHRGFCVVILGRRFLKRSSARWPPSRTFGAAVTARCGFEVELNRGARPPAGGGGGARPRRAGARAPHPAARGHRRSRVDAVTRELLTPPPPATGTVVPPPRRVEPREGIRRAAPTAARLSAAAVTNAAVNHRRRAAPGLDGGGGGGVSLPLAGRRGFISGAAIDAAESR
ncbi:unnamed protein product [Lampetra planeri]